MWNYFRRFLNTRFGIKSFYFRNIIFEDKVAMVNAKLRLITKSEAWQLKEYCRGLVFSFKIKDPDLKLAPVMDMASPQNIQDFCEGSLTTSNNEHMTLGSKVLKARSTSFTDDNFNETSYYFENGLRKVYPYHYKYTTFTKSRWVRKKILDVFAKEFRAHPTIEYEKCMRAGNFTVNNKAVDPDYRLKQGDFLSNYVHRHEVPVTSQPITIVHMDEDTVVVNKPASIPVHPCGRYRHNTVIFILAKEYNLKNLKIVHRLDRLTSGLLLFGRNLDKVRQLQYQISQRLVQKEYVCRVDGEFPEHEIECQEPIKVLWHRITICKVGDGKDSSTVFQRLSYNAKNNTSVVLCKPRTGRMHQIRVHLQYLGYPIVNDLIYNDAVFGPLRGKGGDTGGKNDEELLTDLQAIHDHKKWLLIDNSDTPQFSNPVSGDEAASGRPSGVISVKDALSSDLDCYDCRVKNRDPCPSDLVMYLHAWRYKGPDWEYETELPEWANVDWEEQNTL